MTLDASGLQILSPDQCLELLVAHPLHLGRLAFVVEGYPVVLPVNYRVDHGTVVFRTGLGAKLETAARGALLAFEVDDVDATWEEGWSVLLQGRGREVVDPTELGQVRQLPIRPWGPGERTRYIRLTPEHVSGRRIV